MPLHPSRIRQTSKPLVRKSPSGSIVLLPLLALGVRMPEAALKQAAKTGDLSMVSRLLEKRTVTAEAELQAAACKAATHGNAKVLEKMLEFELDPNKVLTGDDDKFRTRCGMFKFGKQSRENHAVDKLKPETVRVLLKTDNINPDTKITIWDAWSVINFTPAELINTNPDNKNREEICKLLVSNDNADPNTAIFFDIGGPFAKSSKIDNKKLLRNCCLQVCVNLFGQALMFDNFGLAEHLLAMPNMDPGKPSGTGAAENLLIIFMDRYTNGCFSESNWRFDKLITSLKEKIVASNAFTEELLNSQNLEFKQQFLTLFSIKLSEHTPDPSDFAYLENPQLNSEISKILDEAPASCHRLYELAPPSYESVVEGGFHN